MVGVDELKIGYEEQERNLARDASPAFDLPLTTCRYRYIVCSTQRTGSTLVCRALRDTELAGQPLEFFHPRLVRAFLARFGRKGISKDEFLRFLESHRATPNGVFGMKMHHDQLARLCRQKEAREAFLNRFDRVILV